MRRHHSCATRQARAASPGGARASLISARFRYLGHGASPTKEGAEALFEEMAARTTRAVLHARREGVGRRAVASLACTSPTTHPRCLHHPFHLSDSFRLVDHQPPPPPDLTGGALARVEGTDSSLFALEINPEKSREEFRTINQNDGGTGVKDFMDGMGLGILAEQLGELKLGELLDTPPPGLDEAIAISKVIQFLEAPEYSMFSRIVFDTAPTAILSGYYLCQTSLMHPLGEDLEDLTNFPFTCFIRPNDMNIKSKIASATSAIKSVFGQEVQQQDAANKLEQLRERMVKVRVLFRDTESTEFIIVTIPTVMAISESTSFFTYCRLYTLGDTNPDFN
ncbi:hypothetical protein ZWY2020_013731 [Hordeum vulgare]|nr:hypothetical protein ZWY2020_013731 [Hordeum vulgare]